MNLVRAISTIFFLIIYLGSSVFAGGISNSIDAVSYFSGRENFLRELSDNLKLYKKVSIVGISGIGKTQLIRKFIHTNEFEVVWFFDCNRDLSAQYLLLAKYLNKNIKDNSFLIDEDHTHIKQAVLDYLKPKTNWLLVFDNLKLGENDLIRDVIELETNGNIIIAAQDASNLQNVIYLPPLSAAESTELINKILPGRDDVNLLKDYFKGYPLLISQGSMLLKNNNYLAQNHQKILSNQDFGMNSYIDLLVKNLKPSTLELLRKIAVIHNQSFSKKFLEKIVSSQNELMGDIYRLIELGLIINANNSLNLETFEMHDIIKEQVTYLGDSKILKDTISKVIAKITNSLPTSATDLYLAFTNDQTLLANLEKLLSNAELYEIKDNQILILQEKLLAYYVFQRNFAKCEAMKKWLLIYQNNLKIWLMNENEKIIYASYLNYISIYEEWANKNYVAAINLKNEAKDILMSLKNNYEHKFILFTQLAQSYIAVNNIAEANKNLIIAEQFLPSKTDVEILYFLEARILLLQGSFSEALEAINKSIELIKDLPFNSFVTSSFILKARILNYLGNYKEAYEIIDKVYLLEKNNTQYSDLMITTLNELSRSLLGMKKVDVAYKYILTAEHIALKQHKKRNTDISLSQDWMLASLLKTKADCLRAMGSHQQAIASYIQAEIIFTNLYEKDLRNNIMMSSLYFDAAFSSCKLKDKFLFDKFKIQHLIIFGFNHPRSLELLNMKCL